MIREMNLSELEGLLEGQLVGADRGFQSVSTDTRNLSSGDLYVALRGENFDGHDYLQQAREAGAVAALVSRRVEDELPQLVVADTQSALGLLAAANRELFSGPLVAITGSSGKTTAKNMVRSVLSQRGNTLATEGNFNNEIGVPLTLLRLGPESEFAVVEMGAAKRGDIAWLCQLGRPTISLLLNAMPAHLQGFGSVEDVAMAKGEIFDALGSDGVAIINADQPWARKWRARAGSASVLDFSLDAPAAISARAIQSRGIEGVSFIALTPAGDVPVRLHMPGVHNVANALAAIAVGLACELSLDEIRRGLEQVRPVAGRLSAARTGAGVTVIDDCYNANPGSVRAAIDTLADCSGRRTLVLGAMRELGPDSEAMHREIGDYARQAGIDGFWGVGPELAAAAAAFGEGARHFEDRDALVAVLPADLESGDTLLVKGSRSAGMEHIVEALLGGAADQGQRECC
jgi:UDP-N-acetylmuramoyl-tripeptide--D-alanyl-D-alanine ligase